MKKVAGNRIALSFSPQNRFAREMTLEEKNRRFVEFHLERFFGTRFLIEAGEEADRAAERSDGENPPAPKRGAVDPGLAAIAWKEIERRAEGAGVPMLVVRAALDGLKVVEVPTTLSPDGRSRPPHLRTWRDGWRHLKFLLTYSPRWLFLYPGIGFLAIGAAVVALLFPGPFHVGGIGFENKTFIAGCLCLLVGVQSVTFSLQVRRYASRQGYLPRHQRYATFLENLTLERLALAALVLFAAGCGGLAWCLVSWWGAFFGSFDSPMATRLMALSITLLAAATQIFLTAFLGAIMDVGQDAANR